MIEDLDPKLQILFANTKEDLANGGFAEQFLANVEKDKRIRMIIWTGLALVLALAFWLAAAPLQQLVLAITQALTTSVLQQDKGLLVEILAPVNSVAGLLALCLVILQAVLRRIWS